MDFKSPREFMNPLSRQDLVNFTSLVSRVNVIVYKIEPIFTGPRHGKLCDKWLFHWGALLNVA